MRHLIILGALALAGCGQTAFAPVFVDLAPRVDVPEARVGEGRAVALEVVDRRPDPSVGERRHGIVEGSRIELAQPIEATVHAALASALQRRGFVLAEGAMGGARLVVEVRELSYVPEGGAFGARATSVVALHAEARAGDRFLSRDYRIADSDRMAIASSEHFNSGRLSAMLGEVLRRMVSDPEMMAVLAGP